jgi:hypothetical protein
MKSGKIEDGGKGEWLKPAVLKSVPAFLQVPHNQANSMASQ